MKVGAYIQTKHPVPQSVRRGVVVRTAGKWVWVRLHGQVKEKQLTLDQVEEVETK
jgi:hypothetical protein